MKDRANPSYSDLLKINITAEKISQDELFASQENIYENLKDDFCLETILSFDLRFLLKRKGLKENIFEVNDSKITLDADIKEHSAWLFRHIYAFRYPDQAIHEEEIARFYHGIQHVSRAAVYIPIFANLYRRYGNQQALELSQEELKLLQIAVLFHDAAREDEEEDLWDHESATLLYFYLTRILNLTKNLAKKMAEAVANKDWSFGKPYLVLDEINGEVLWSLKRVLNLSKNIYQQLIHDSDCLDVIRARDLFNGKKLDFYQEVVCLDKQNRALDEMAELIIRARSLIELEGDARGRTKAKIKKVYENENAYSTILNDIHNGNYLILEALYAKGQLLSKEELEKLTLIDADNILNQQRIFARGIVTPTAFAKKLLTKNLNEPQPETFANLEFRKTKRRKGITTNTSKADGLNKEGNPNRSVSLLGGSVFADAGCLIFNPDLSLIKAVYAVDSDTGWGKKKYSHTRSCTISDGMFTELTFQKNLLQKISPVSITLDKLEKNMKLGGSVRYFKGRNHPISFNEILYDIKQYDAIYYTFDPTSANELFHGNSENTQSGSTILKAIYLQFAYREAFGEILPIYEYSGIHHYLKKIPPFNEEQIIHMWLEVCQNFIKKKIEKGHVKELSSYSISKLMAMAMYKKVKQTIIFNDFTDACSNYPEHLAKTIKNLVINARETLIAEHKKVVSKKLGICMQTLASTSFLTDEIYQELIKTFELATKADLNLIIPKYDVYLFIRSRLTKMKPEDAISDDLCKLIIIACAVGIIQELKTSLSKLMFSRWFNYHDDDFDPNKPLYLSDILPPLHSLFNKHDEIDLAYINILEITNGSASSVIFLNELYRNKPNKLLNHFLKSPTTPIPNSDINKFTSSSGHCTFFQADAINKNTDREISSNTGFESMKNS